MLAAADLERRAQLGRRAGERRLHLRGRHGVVLAAARRRRAAPCARARRRRRRARTSATMRRRRRPCTSAGGGAKPRSSATVAPTSSVQAQLSHAVLHGARAGCSTSAASSARQQHARGARRRPGARCRRPATARARAPALRACRRASAPRARRRRRRGPGAGASSGSCSDDDVRLLAGRREVAARRLAGSASPRAAAPARGRAGRAARPRARARRGTRPQVEQVGDARGRPSSSRSLPTTPASSAPRSQARSTSPAEPQEPGGAVGPR